MPRRAALAVATAVLGALVALPAAPASACGSPNCEEFNELCYRVLRMYCLR